MRHVTALALALLLSACETAWQGESATATSLSRGPRLDPIGDENSPYYLVPVGSRLTLNRALTVPANDVGVYIQNGEVAKSFWNVKSHYPYCAFDLRKRLETPQTVQPDEFTITRVSQETVQSVDTGFTRQARVPFGHLADAVPDGGASYEIYATLMTLRSERQPNVQRLTCAQWEYPPLQRHVTINEMRKTLGNLFTLRLPGKN